MKIESFRELLLRKSADNPNLQTLVKYARDEIIAEKVLESLEKMARAGHKGDAANFAVRDFGMDMDPEMHPHMIRDALGHHVSRYKQALGKKNQALANQHARQAFRLMNLADTAQKHSHGKLSIDYVPTQPWERNKLTNTYGEDHPKVKEGKYKPGDFTTKTKGLNYKGSDFSWLQQAPHESYSKEIKRHGHTGAYPFEHIKVNGKHIHIDDDVDSHTYEPHEFDHHPIMNHFEHSVKKRTPEMDQKYVESKQKYYDEEPHVDNWFDRHEKLQQELGDEYHKRGEKPSDPVHAPLENPLKFDEQPKPEAGAEDAPKPGAATTPSPGKKPDLKSVDLSGVDLSTIPPDILKKLGIEPPKGDK